MISEISWAHTVSKEELEELTDVWRSSRIYASSTHCNSRLSISPCMVLAATQSQDLPIYEARNLKMVSVRYNQNVEQ